MRISLFFWYLRYLGVIRGRQGDPPPWITRCLREPLRTWSKPLESLTIVKHLQLMHFNLLNHELSSEPSFPALQLYLLRHTLRLPYRNDSEIAKFCNLRRFWPVIQLINHPLLAELQAKTSKGCRILLFQHHSYMVTLKWVNCIACSFNIMWTINKILSSDHV